MKLKAFLICSICLLSIYQLYPQIDSKGTDFTFGTVGWYEFNGHRPTNNNVQGSPYVDDNYSLVENIDHGR